LGAGFFTTLTGFLAATFGLGFDFFADTFGGLGGKGSGCGSGVGSTS